MPGSTKAVLLFLCLHLMHLDNVTSLSDDADAQTCDVIPSSQSYLYAYLQDVVKQEQMELQDVRIPDVDFPEIMANQVDHSVLMINNAEQNWKVKLGEVYQLIRGRIKFSGCDTSGKSIIIEVTYTDATMQEILGDRLYLQPDELDFDEEGWYRFPMTPVRIKEVEIKVETALGCADSLPEIQLMTTNELLHDVSNEATCSCKSGTAKDIDCGWIMDDDYDVPTSAENPSNGIPMKIALAKSSTLVFVRIRLETDSDFNTSIAYNTPGQTKTYFNTPFTLRGRILIERSLERQYVNEIEITISSKGNTNIAEIEIYAESTGAINAATSTGTQCTSSSNSDNCSKTFDGDQISSGDEWITQLTGDSPWIEITLPEVYILELVRFRQRTLPDSAPRTIEDVSVLFDDGSCQEFQVSLNKVASVGGARWHDFNIHRVATQRINISVPTSPFQVIHGFMEIELYGYPNGTAEITQGPSTGWTFDGNELGTTESTELAVSVTSVHTDSNQTFPTDIPTLEDPGEVNSTNSPTSFEVNSTDPTSERDISSEPKVTGETDSTASDEDSDEDSSGDTSSTTPAITGTDSGQNTVPYLMTGTDQDTARTDPREFTDTLTTNPIISHTGDRTEEFTTTPIDHTRPGTTADATSDDDFTDAIRSTVDPGEVETTAKDDGGTTSTHDPTAAPYEEGSLEYTIVMRIMEKFPYPLDDDTSPIYRHYKGEFVPLIENAMMKCIPFRFMGIIKKLFFWEGSIQTSYSFDVNGTTPLTGPQQSAIMDQLVKNFNESGYKVDPKSFVVNYKNNYVPPDNSKNLLLAGVLGGVVTIALLGMVIITILVFKYCRKRRAHEQEAEAVERRGEVSQWGGSNHSLQFQLPRAVLPGSQMRFQNNVSMTPYGSLMGHNVGSLGGGIYSPGGSSFDAHSPRRHSSMDYMHGPAAQLPGIHEMYYNKNTSASAPGAMMQLNDNSDEDINNIIGLDTFAVGSPSRQSLDVEIGDEPHTGSAPWGPGREREDTIHRNPGQSSGFDWADVRNNTYPRQSLNRQISQDSYFSSGGSSYGGDTPAAGVNMHRTAEAFSYLASSHMDGGHNDSRGDPPPYSGGSSYPHEAPSHRRYIPRSQITHRTPVRSPQSDVSYDSHSTPTHEVEVENLYDSINSPASRSHHQDDALSLYYVANPSLDDEGIIGRVNRSLETLRRSKRDAVHRNAPGYLGNKKQKPNLMMHRHRESNI